MNLTQIVERIQVQCPAFVLVDHVLSSPITYPYPTALVVPVESRSISDPNDFEGSYRQDIQLVVGVYIIIERRQNQIGDLGGAEQFDTLCAAVRAALINWQPTGANRPMSYAGGKMAPYDAGVVTWREDFTVDFEVRSP